MKGFLVTCGLAAFLFGSGAPAWAASTKLWSQYRDSAKAALRGNDLEQALQDYNLAFAEAENAFKGTDLRYLNTAIEAGQLNRQLRKYDSAIAIYQKALERLKSPKGDEPLFKAFLLTDLAKAYLYSGKLAPAEETFQNSLAFTRERVSDRNPLVPQCLVGLGEVYSARKEYERALPLMLEALKLSKSPELLQFQSNQRSGRGEWYQPLSEASIQNGIGILYFEQKNYPEAEKWYSAAFQNTERRLGKTDPELDPLLKNLARTYNGAAKYDRAEEVLFRVIAIDLRTPGGALRLLEAAALFGQVEYAQDDKNLESSLQRLLAPDGPQIKEDDYYQFLGVMARHYASKDWARMNTLVEKGLAAGTARFGQQSTGPARLYTVLAGLALEQKKPADAIRYLNSSIDLLNAREGSTSAALADPLTALAAIYGEEKNFSEAEKTHDRIIALNRAAFGEKDSRVANAIENKAALVDASGDKSRADKLREEANRVRISAFVN